MFKELDEAIRNLLGEEMPLVKNGKVDVDFHQPKRDWSGRLNKPTINFFLYDIRENNILRQQSSEFGSVNFEDKRALFKHPTMRVDCTYMITTWATVPEEEHQLMASTIMTLFRFPVLPEKYLVGNLLHSPSEIRTCLADHHVLTDPADVWASLDNEMRPSVSYVVTLALDAWKEEVTCPLVEMYEINLEKSLEHKGVYDVDSQTSGITGIVRNKQGNPVPKAKVWVKEREAREISAISNREGRYLLTGLRPGLYHLVVGYANEEYEQPEPVSAPAWASDITILQGG